MKKIIVIIIFITFSLTTLGQCFNFYGGIHSDAGGSVQQTNDGGYILVGTTSIDGNNNSDVFLIKTNHLRDTIWTKKYGGNGYDQGKHVQQTLDGGYVICGSTVIGGLQYSYLIKTNSIGDTLWTKSFGGNNMEESYYVQQSSDGGYIFTGFRENNFYNFDLIATKTDSLGNLIWSKIFLPSGQDYFSMGFGVNQTSDGGYIIGGLYMDFMSGDYGVAIKTDSQGDTLWTRFYDNPEIQSITQTSDGGYIATGGEWISPTNKNLMLLKIDSNGDSLWAKSFGGNNQDFGNSVQQTSDGGYIAFGTSRQSQSSYYGVYIVRTDNLGDTLWTKKYGDGFDFTGLYIQETSDGGYIASGHCDVTGNGELDIFLLKIDSIGNIFSSSTINQTVCSTYSINGQTFDSTGNYIQTLTNSIGCDSLIYINLTVLDDPIPPNICVVTVDSSSSQNKLIWEKQISDRIVSYNIFRELGTNNYIQIGNVNYDSLSFFIDNTNNINPNTTSYRYKISTVDTCGFESDLSDFHESIHLTTSVGASGEFNLVWDPYEGFQFSFYRILRDSTFLGNWEVIDSVSSNNTTYTDNNPPLSGASYIVEVLTPSLCTPTKSSISSSRSNSSTNGISTLVITNKVHNLLVHPNPTQDLITLEIEGYNGPINVEVYDLTGKLLKTTVYTTISMGEYAKGIYVFKVNYGDVSEEVRVVRD